MFLNTFLRFILVWPVIVCVIAATSSAAMAAEDTADGVVMLSAVIKQSSCVPDFQMSINNDRPVQLPKIPSSNFKKNSLSAVSYFSLKLKIEQDTDSSVHICKGVNLLNGIQFDSTPNATSVLGLLKNQATDNPAQNINVELILFSSDWSQQHLVNLQSKEPIDFNMIPGWTQQKQDKQVKQLNFGVRYSKDASTNEEVKPGTFYVVLPFMLKFN